jgi:uncharacterized protein DUF7008
MIDEIGRTTHTGDDDAFYLSRFSARTKGFLDCCVPLVTGEDVRDYAIRSSFAILFPYDQSTAERIERPNGPSKKHYWSLRSRLRTRSDFGQKVEDRGLTWYEHSMFFPRRYKRPLCICFSNVATHNHFVLQDGRQVYNSHAPGIWLKANLGKDKYCGLAGILNSSSACFWMKQTFHNKGGGGIGGGLATESWEQFYEFDATKLKQFPVPEELPETISQGIYSIGREEDCPTSSYEQHPEKGSRADSIVEFAACEDSQLSELISRQEEIDWQCYRLYGLTSGGHLEWPVGRLEDLPPVKLGERTFEIVMARRMAAGEIETTWFERHNSTPITKIPEHWPRDYQRLIERRIEHIESDRNIRLIEQPEYKRRWNTESLESQRKRAMKNWLLDRLEGYFDFDGRINDEAKPTSMLDIALCSAAQLADIARQDPQFQKVGALYTDDSAFDVARLVTEVIVGESVPHLPVLRYRPSGLRKREEWEKTWALQREEDELARQRAAAQQAISEARERVERTLDKEQVTVSKVRSDLAERREAFTKHWLHDKKFDASVQPETLAAHLKYDEKALLCASEMEAIEDLKKQLKELESAYDKELTKRLKGDKAYQEAQDRLEVIPADPKIEVPPKYKSGDFLRGHYWRLRGKLDVSKERWVSFPHCERQDGTLMIAWAGYDHFQLAKAISAHYVDVQERIGGRDDPRLIPLLASLIELLPWLKQWHNEVDPEFNIPMGDYFEGFIQEEARGLGKTLDEIRAWQPPQTTRSRGRRKKKVAAVTHD